MSTETTWDELRKNLPADHLSAFDDFVETLQSENDELKSQVEVKESDIDCLVRDQDDLLQEIRDMLHGFFYLDRTTVSAEEARRLMVKVDRYLEEPR